jgi:micrococcal nuclease
MIIIAVASSLGTAYSLGGTNIIFRTSPDGISSNEVMRITSDGKVGINTTNPQSTLDVNGNITSPTISNLDARISDIENTFLDPTSNCSGSAGCIPGYVTQNIDGDTLKVYGKSIRLALVDAPESNEPGYTEANNFIANTCPVDSFAIVDEDDMQTGGTFGRIIGVVHCNGVNLNEAILDAGLADLAVSFCSSSEFEFSTWAQNHGC